MARYRLDVAELYRALDRRRGLRGLNWKQVGEETDLPDSFFSRLKRGKGDTKPSADALCTLLTWLGEGHAITFTKEQA